MDNLLLRRREMMAGGGEGPQIIRLVASTYSHSYSSGSVSNEQNMYTNVDSDTYGTANGKAGKSVKFYLRGFNFSDVPADAQIISCTIKTKFSKTGSHHSTSLGLYNGTSIISGSYPSVPSAAFSTPEIFILSKSISFATLSSYGSNFGIGYTMQVSSGYSGSLQIYGAEIEVKYSLP